MGTVTRLFDGLKNAITGQGTGRDARTASTYIAAPLTQQEIDAAYRGSGLLRKIIQIPALDMVREWRDWSGLDDDQAAAVWDEEKRLGVREKAKQAETLRGLGGGAFILGLPGDPSTPAPKTIEKGALAFVNVVSRWHLSFDTLQDDAREPGFGEPTMWRLNTARTGQQAIHPSRVITFRADTSATLISTATTNSADAYWGESRLAQVLDAVKDSDAARGAFASLLHKARLTRIGIPNLTDLVSTREGEKALSSRLATIALAESMFNAAVYDAGNGDTPAEKIDDVAYNFAGAKDILNAFAEFVAAIADIPATRLLGRAPEGMNSSGDSQQKDWAKKVRAMQTLELGPCLDRLDAFLVPSALGKTEPEASYAFAPLDVETDTERAARFAKQMEAAEKLAGLNAMPEEAFNRGLQSLMIAEGYLPELEAALAEIPDDERYGIMPDPSLGDPNADPSAAKGGDPAISAPGGAAVPPVAANDAAPRTLYVQRRLLNASELIDWAKAQGFETTAPADQLHVTVAYSRQPVDWMKVGQDWHGDEAGNLTVPAGGARLVEPLGDKGAVVLLFSSSALSWRHEAIKEAGASFDFEQYQPHVTITYNAPEGLDLAKVEPYRGKLEFGPEIFEEISEGWASNLEEA